MSRPEVSLTSVFERQPPLTHRVAVEQEEAVRGPLVLHNQIKRMGSIKVGLFLCWRRKHQR